MTITPEKLREISDTPMPTGRVVHRVNFMNRVRRSMRDAADAIEVLGDRADGLDSELRMAVQTAYNRGAHEWARLNYPQWIEWLERSAALDELGRLDGETLS